MAKMGRPVGSKRRKAERLPDWKRKNKQLKPKFDKDAVQPEEKRTMTEHEKVLFERYKITPEWMQK